MASNVQFSNFAAGSLTAPLSKTATSLTQVLATNALNFPTVSNPTYFYATIIDQASYAAGISPPNVFEIIKVITYSGSGAMTITRAQDNTSAQNWNIGDRIELRLTAQAIADATGASGAPSTTPYLTLAFDAGLSAERLFTPGVGMTGTDAGANNTYTFGMTNMAAAGVLGATAAGPVVQLTGAQVATITNAIINGGGAVSLASGTHAGRPAFGTAGRFYYETDTFSLFFDTGAAWALISPALTGDVTNAGGSLATTIAANAVTNAKMATMAANTVKGSIAGGNPIDLNQTQITSLINVFTSGASGAVSASGGGTVNFLRADGTWATPPGSSALNTPYNVIINGGMIVNQRRVTPAITTSPQYGIDKWTGWLSAGALTSGTLAPSGGGFGRTGNLLGATTITATGTSQISFRTRIESVDAIRLKNATASFSCLAYQDSGSTQTVVVVVRKPTITDNYGAVTVIGTSGGTSVVTGNATQVTFNNISMGDCSTGIEIEVQIPIGNNPAAKNAYMTEAVLAEGGSTPVFPYLSFEDELFRCKRYYQKTFPYATTPAQNGGVAGAVVFPAAAAAAGTDRFSQEYETPLRTSVTPTTYNPSAANAQARDLTAAADCSAMTLTTVSERGIHVAQVTGNAGSAVGNAIGFHYTLDADL